MVARVQNGNGDGLGQVEPLSMHIETTESQANEVSLQAAEPVAVVLSTHPDPFFRYYIHDAVDTFRIELVGELTAAGLKDVSGCFTTASDTLGSRTVILDVRRLRVVDVTGRAWLLRMVENGACYGVRLRSKKWQLSNEWTPPAPRERLRTTSGRLRLRIRSLFAGSRAKEEEADLEGPWADCRS